MAAGGALILVGTYALDHLVCPGDVFQLESHLTYQCDRFVRSPSPRIHQAGDKNLT